MRKVKKELLLLVNIDLAGVLMYKCSWLIFYLQSKKVKDLSLQFMDLVSSPVSKLSND